MLDRAAERDLEELDCHECCIDLSYRKVHYRSSNRRIVPPKADDDNSLTTLDLLWSSRFQRRESD